MRCWAEGQEEKGKHRVGRKEGRAPGIAARAFPGCEVPPCISSPASGDPYGSGGSPLYWGVNLRISAGRVS